MHVGVDRIGHYRTAFLAGYLEYSCQYDDPYMKVQYVKTVGKWLGTLSDSYVDFILQFHNRRLLFDDGWHNFNFKIFNISVSTMQVHLWKKSETRVTGQFWGFDIDSGLCEILILLQLAYFDT